jgi:hypothetical protein
MVFKQPRARGHIHANKEVAMPTPDASSTADSQVLTLFQEELARAAAMPGLASLGPLDCGSITRRVSV